MVMVVLPVEPEGWHRNQSACWVDRGGRGLHPPRCGERLMKTTQTSKPLDATEKPAAKTIEQEKTPPRF